MWVSGQVVYVQNQILFMDSLEHPFDPRNPYVNIPTRKIKTADGEKISEWRVPLQDVQRFARTIA